MSTLILSLSSRSAQPFPIFTYTCNITTILSHLSNLAFVAYNRSTPTTPTAPRTKLMTALTVPAPATAMVALGLGLLVPDGVGELLVDRVKLAQVSLVALRLWMTNDLSPKK